MNVNNVWHKVPYLPRQVLDQSNTDQQYYINIHIEKHSVKQATAFNSK